MGETGSSLSRTYFIDFVYCLRSLGDHIVQRFSIRALLFLEFVQVLSVRLEIFSLMRFFTLERPFKLDLFPLL